MNSTDVTIILSVGNMEFIKEGAQPAITKRYIGGKVIVTDKPNEHEEHALLIDHQGSTVALVKVNSIDLKQLDYDAFGKRRSLRTLSELLQGESAPINKLTTTGFTGHEMLDDMGLIHMNGRVYSPSLGRFLSADPYITEPTNTQNMNRYSYVYNNPMVLTDPSGFEMVPGVTTWGRRTPVGSSGLGSMSYGVTTRWEWSSGSDDGYSLSQGDTIYGDESGNFATTNELIKAGLMTYEIGPNGKVNFSLVNKIGTVQSSVTPTITINSGDSQPISNGGGSVDGDGGAEEAQPAPGGGTIPGSNVPGPDGGPVPGDREGLQGVLDGLVTDGTLNPNMPFNTEKEAADAVFGIIAKLSAQYKFELGGHLKHVGGHWYYTMPQILQSDHGDILPVSIGYHTHTKGLFRFSNSLNHAGPGWDTKWVMEGVGQALYLGQYMNGEVNVGVCKPDRSCGTAIEHPLGQFPSGDSWTL